MNPGAASPSRKRRRPSAHAGGSPKLWEAPIRSHLPTSAIWFRRLLAVSPLLSTTGLVLTWRVGEAVRHLERARGEECARYLRITLPMPGYLHVVSWLAIAAVVAGLLSGVPALGLPAGRKRTALCGVYGVAVVIYASFTYHALVNETPVPTGACGG
jgi:hypothetical protein